MLSPRSDKYFKILASEKKWNQISTFEKAERGQGGIALFSRTVG